MGYREKEPVPISEDKPLQEYFEHIKDQHIVDFLRKVHETTPVSIDTIAYFLNCDSQKAHTVLKEITNDFSDFI